ALSWRIDSRLIASSSEDGTIKLWDATEGKQSKTWNAHSGGVLCVAYGPEGQFVTAGRDGLVITWSPDATKLKTCDFAGEPALRCSFTQDASRVVGAHFRGRVAVCDAKSGKRL